MSDRGDTLFAYIIIILFFTRVLYDLIDTETHTELALISVVCDHRTALQNKKNHALMQR